MTSVGWLPYRNSTVHINSVTLTTTSCHWLDRKSSLLLYDCDCVLLQ